MQPVPFIPRYKLLLDFDILPGRQQNYIRFLLGEFAPTAREMGVHLYMAWHIAYGDYPMRQLVFVAEDLDTIQRALNSARWRHMEERLKTYVSNYSRKLVHYKERFQL